MKYLRRFIHLIYVVYFVIKERKKDGDINR